MFSYKTPAHSCIVRSVGYGFYKGRPSDHFVLSNNPNLGFGWTITLEKLYALNVWQVQHDVRLAIQPFRVCQAHHDVILAIQPFRVCQAHHDVRLAIQPFRVCQAHHDVILANQPFRVCQAHHDVILAIKPFRVCQAHHDVILAIQPFKQVHHEVCKLCLSPSRHANGHFDCHR